MQFHSSYKCAETSELNFFHGHTCTYNTHFFRQTCDSRERETDRQTQTDTDRQKQAGIQIDRKTETETERDLNLENFNTQG